MKIHTLSRKQSKGVRIALKRIFDVEPEVSGVDMTNRLRRMPEHAGFSASISFGTVSAWMTAMRRGVDVTRDGWIIKFKALPQTNERFTADKVSPYRELVKILSAENELSSGEARKRLESIGIVKDTRWMASNFGAARRELELTGKATKRIKKSLSGVYLAARDLVNKDHEIGYRELHKLLTKAGMVLNPLQAKDLFRKARVELNIVGQPTRTHKWGKKLPVQTFNKDGSPRKHKISSIVKEAIVNEQAQTSTIISPTSEQIITAITDMSVELKKIRQEKLELLSTIKKLSDEKAVLIKENASLHENARKEMEQKIELEMSDGQSENSLIGSKRPY